MIRIAHKRACDGGSSASHHEKKKPVPKGAAQMSKASFPRLIRRYSGRAVSIPPSRQSIRDTGVVGNLPGAERNLHGSEELQRRSLEVLDWVMPVGNDVCVFAELGQGSPLSLIR
jgi:hypothetical protein